MYHFSQSPQPEMERMFRRGGSRRSSSSARGGLREIQEEATISEEDEPLVKRSGFGPFSVKTPVANPVTIRERADAVRKLYVAVGEDIEDGRSNILWAARNMLAGDSKLVLLHVHQPARRIMTGLRNVSASQRWENELKAYRKSDKGEKHTPLNQYLNFCRVSLKTEVETLVIENNSPANGIIELVDQNHITSLVMGTSSFSPQREVPESKVAAIVYLQAKPYCQIFYICNETLACSRHDRHAALKCYIEFAISSRATTQNYAQLTEQLFHGSLLSFREATQLSAKVESSPSSCTSCVSDQRKFPPRYLSLPPGRPSFLGSTDQQAHQRQPNSVNYTYPLAELIADKVENISATMQWPIDMTPTGFTSNSNQQSTGASSSGLKDLESMDGLLVPVSIASSKEHEYSMVENVIQREVFEQLHQVHNELESSRKEASKGPQKTKRGLFEASMMFKAQENSLRKEKKELEERLTREKIDLKKEHIHICNELQKANEQRADLENKLLQANSLIEELKQLQVQLQREKDHAVRQARKMHQMNSNPVSGSTGAVALTEFSYEEIKEATNNFGDSRKIGQGGFGSVYKGFIRHTAVAIKKVNREGTAGEKEFNDEVEILCRMRHPNLVTLIGVCREAKALVFEFLSNGSLEDCLQRKHQRKPLLWQMRIRIAADICTGLIFLHSNKPKGIAHGDLKPDNVLLDTNFVCKLADKGTMGYMDPVYIASGELTAQYDVYSFGVVLLRLLTGKSPLGLPNEVEAALRNAMLQDIVDTSAGEWPPEYTEELARLALRCCRYDRKERPDLAEVWDVLQAMMNCPDQKCQPPTFIICPMTQEIMRDPHIAADGFTYEGDAIKDWLKGHKMSPMTYRSFAHHELIPNNALRFAIQEWQMQQQP